MEEVEGKITTFDEYIAQFPEDVQQLLLKIRATIKESAPEASGKNKLPDAGLFSKRRTDLVRRLPAAYRYLPQDDRDDGAA